MSEETAIARTAILKDDPSNGGAPLFSIVLPEDCGECTFLFQDHQPFVFIVMRRGRPLIWLRPQHHKRLAVEITECGYWESVSGDALEMATRLARAWEQRTDL